MKKLILICLLILGTQLVFARPCSTPKTGKDIVNLKPQYRNDYSTATLTNFTFIGIYANDEGDDYSTKYLNYADWVMAYGDDEQGDYSTQPTIPAVAPERYANDERGDYSTGNKDAVDLEVILKVKTGIVSKSYNGNLEDEYGEIRYHQTDILSAEQKNAIAERYIKILLFTTPGNTEKDNNVSLYNKAIEIFKTKYKNLIIG